MLHHSFTKDGDTVSVPAIREFHLAQGWRDIGYHYLLEVVGYGNGKRSLELIVGRPETEQASACPQGGMNVAAIHYCVVGAFDDAAPSDEVYEKLARHLRSACERYGIPVENIVGHHDFNAGKTCPGRLFDLERVRRMCR
jgi:hypothetical protein